jgi:LDH2 family malate/lactate/ureidoglycolate dehydrogenase
MQRLPIATLRAQTQAVFDTWGMASAATAAAVEVMGWADERGVDSHGISLLTSYYAGLVADRLITLDPVVAIERDMPVVTTIDGGNGLGYRASLIACDSAIKKAKALGVAVSTVRNSHHFGAAGAYVDRIAAAGLVGFAMTSVHGATVVATRSAGAMFGTNPIAFAAPGKDGPPFLLDMATSTSAVGRIKVRALAGKPLPAGWAYDETGAITTDAARALEARLMTPLGATPETSSHKGYGLAAMVEILSALLSGATWFHHAPERPDVGHWFCAMDPAAFGDADRFYASIDAMGDTLRQATPINPAEPVLVPGDPERAERARRLADGVPVLPKLAEDIEKLCRRIGAPYLLG